MVLDTPSIAPCKASPDLEDVDLPTTKSSGRSSSNHGYFFLGGTGATSDTASIVGCGLYRPGITSYLGTSVLPKSVVTVFCLYGPVWDISAVIIPPELGTLGAGATDVCAVSGVDVAVDATVGATPGVGGVLDEAVDVLLGTELPGGTGSDILVCTGAVGLGGTELAPLPGVWVAT